MPVIHTHVSVSTTPGQREALKAAYGKAITAVPGKSEGWLMCPFEDNMPIYFGGDDSKPPAYVEGTVETSDEVPPFLRGLPILQTSHLTYGKHV